MVKAFKKAPDHINMEILQGRAFALFLGELCETLREIEYFLNSTADCDAEDKERLRSIFHKVKGGAGFFSLDKIREIGAELEAIFKADLGEIAGNKSRVEVLYEDLKQAFGELANPDTKES